MHPTNLGNWQKSSFSGFGDGNNCLELASTPTALHLRESDTPTAVLATTRAPLAHLLVGIRTDAIANPISSRPTRKSSCPSPSVSTA